MAPTSHESEPPGIPGQFNRVLVADRVDLSLRCRAFLHASIRRDRFRRARAITILSVLLALALAAAGIAIIQQRTAQDKQLIATARQLIAQADSARESDPRTALLLGIAARHIHPDFSTQSSLVNTLTSTRYAGTLAGHSGDVDSVAFAPDGRILATGSSDKTVLLWDLTDPAQPRRLGQPLTGHVLSVQSVASSGRTLATGGEDKTVLLWDLTDPAQPRRLGQPLTGPTDSVATLAFSPDGRTLAGEAAEDAVILWDLTDLTQPRRLGQPLTGPISKNYIAGSVSFSPDGQSLVTGGLDDTIIWDLKSLNYLQAHATDRACSITGRGLDRDEWSRNISGLAYRNTCQT